MRKQNVYAVLLLASFSIFCSSCHKEQPKEEAACTAIKGHNSTPCFNLNVVLHGARNQSGYIKFRQNPDSDKIITLQTKVEHLNPNHEYLLQRAVDAINVVDGNCTSTSWLTLGKGLTPRSIFTDHKGNGQEELWRDVTAIATGSTFDIHFRVIDAVTMAVVLTSDCYQYTVR